MWPSWIVWICIFKFLLSENDFSTRFTFVMFVAFMNCVDVKLQRSCSSKWSQDFCAFHNLHEYDSSNYLLEKKICHKGHFCRISLLDEQFWYDALIGIVGEKIGYKCCRLYINSLILSWTKLKWFYNFFLELKTVSQISHVWFVSHWTGTSFW